MAYNYNNYKKFYEAMDSQQQQKRATQNKNDADFQDFYSQYTNESRNNNVAAPSTNNSNRYGSGSYTYNPNSGYYEKTSPKTSGDGVYKYDPATGYYENTSSPKTNQYTDYSKYNNTGSNTGNSQSFYGNNQNYTGNANTLNGTLAGMANDIYNQGQKGYSDLMGGSNYATNFDDAVNNKLKSAFGLNSLDELKNKYPEQYESVVQALESVRSVWDATDPTQRQMLDGYLQGIIGSGVGAGSDMSKLNVLNQSLMDKFENGEQVSKDMQNIVKLQTEGLTTKEIAKQMGISEDQVQQAILAYNGLDNKLGEYYKLKEGVAKDITEKFDTQMQRNDEEKRIALERANRQVDRLTEDFNTSIERQKQQNDINAHNADAIAGRTGLGFSKRGIEGLNYVAEQARQIIDDITKNYDRNNQNLADGIADIIRNWQYNNDDLMKASEDALTAAKNNFTSNMLAVQQQYGTVGLQAQQALANNVQGFIEQAEAIYDNALTRQQQNLTNLINNVSNINALEAQNLTMRNAKIQQFQQEALTMNRSQLQQLAQQLGMSSDEFGDLVSYQVQAVQNQLNGYVPGAGVMFQDEINSLLQGGANAQEVIQWVMNQPEFKAMSQTGGTDEWVRLNDNTLYNKKDGTFKSFNGEGGSSDYSSTSYEMGNYGATNNYVSSQTVNGQDYGVSENTYYGLQDFISSHQVGSTGGQCGKFVNDYLQSLGLDRVFTDPIDKKKAAINTPEGYKPQVGDIVIMDSPTSRKYGHVAIVTAVDGDKITTLESNKKGEGEVFSRTIDTSKQNRLGGQIFGYYHPDGNTTNISNNAGTMGAATGGTATGETPIGNMSEYDKISAVANITKMAFGGNASDNDAKRVERLIELGDNAGKTENEIAYNIVGWKNIKPEYQDIADKLANTMKKSTEGMNGFDCRGIVELLNKGDISGAILKVENTMMENDAKAGKSTLGVSTDADARHLMNSIQAIRDNINSYKHKDLAFGWADAAMNSLNTSMFGVGSGGRKLYNETKSDFANLFNEYRNSVFGSALTETEIKESRKQLPTVSDKLSEVETKFDSFSQSILSQVNSRRVQLGLPKLTMEQLLDPQLRVDLYYGTSQPTTTNTTTNTNGVQGRIGSNIQAGGTMQSGRKVG